MDPPEQHHHNLWFVKLLSVQSDIISECLLSLTSPFLSIFSLASTPVHRVEDTKETVTTPSTVVHGSSILLRKAVLGFVGAAYVCLVLTAVMVVSVVLGVALVRMWVEEPVYLKQNMYFDYADAHPYAVLDLGFAGPGKLPKTVPVGHTCNVRLVFVMPESDYNREIGNFQVVAEALSTNQKMIASSSHPCMLRFSSGPLRLMKTFVMGVPLLLGITSEIQTVNVQVLKYKEHHHHRTQSIRISLIPRAGTPFLPQLYEAKAIVSSELPWRKELVRSWKWTFYVWTSLYIYIMLLAVLICCFRSVMFPVVTTVSSDPRVDVWVGEPRRVIGARERPVSETLKRWRQSRSKRKAMLLGGGSPDSEATSMSVTRDEDASVATEEVGDSESVCQ